MVIAAALPAPLPMGRLPSPNTRPSRMSFGLSLGLHGLALVPLLLLGIAEGTAGEEPALLVEVLLAAPAPSGESASPPQPFAGFLQPQPQTPAEPTADSRQQPASDSAAETLPTKAIELPTPEEPPELKMSEIKPPDPPPSPPKPQSRPQPAKSTPAVSPARAAAAKAPPSPVTQTQAPPDKGTDLSTQQAVASTSAGLFRGFALSDGRPRFRSPPRPADYPSRAVELGQQGEALVRVRLDPDGNAAEILLWRGTGFELLDRSALAAVRGWHFLPAQRNGQPVAAWVEIPVRFHLR